MNKEKKQFILAVAVAVVALVWFYIASIFFFNKNMLISIHSVTWDNIFIKLAQDYSVMLFIPTILLIINRKNLKDFDLCMESRKEIYLLFSILIIFFILHNDYSIRGIYRFFFYLIVISFGEEFLFRGFVYNKLKFKSKAVAIILSGMLWGAGHAILPSILESRDILYILFAMRNYIVGGILSGWYFIYLQEKSKTLLVPILIHALMDYSFSFFGPLVALIIFIYLKKQYRS